MIKAEDLDGIKLVTEENNFASDDDTLNVLEAAFMQGSQGWGVTKETAILLRLARVLYAALKLAETADENARLLKGAQMELGRVKKQRNTLKTALDSLAEELVVIKQVVDAENLQKLDAQKIASAYMETIVSLKARVAEVEKYNVDLAAENVILNSPVDPAAQSTSK